MNKAIIFDMGGVIVDLDIEGCKAAFKERLGYHNIDNIIDACHQKGIYGDLEEGKLTAEEFRSIVIADSRPGSDPMDVDRAMWHILVGIEPYCRNHTTSICSATTIPSACRGLHVSSLKPESLWKRSSSDVSYHMK